MYFDKRLLSARRHLLHILLLDDNSTRNDGMDDILQLLDLYKEENQH